MARPLRITFPGAIYHVNCRMIGDSVRIRDAAAAKWPAERRLFRDVADHERFLENLSDRIEQYGVRLYLFVLMTNHFHLVLETPKSNCSQFMQSLETAYSVYYNLRHDRHGHLLDGRYKAKVVEGDDYLLALSRYVHLNPVRSKENDDSALTERIRFLRTYPWSSYPSYIGRRKPLGFVEYGPLLAQMNGRTGEWPRLYREFVETGLVGSDDDFEAMLHVSPRSIGGDRFRAWVDRLYHEQLERRVRREDVSFRRVTEVLQPEVVLAALAKVMGVDVSEFGRRQRNSPMRAMASHLLIRRAGLNQRQVADLLNMGSGAAVSKQLARHAEAFDHERSVKKTMGRVEKLLESVEEDL